MTILHEMLWNRSCINNQNIIKIRDCRDEDAMNLKLEEKTIETTAITAHTGAIRHKLAMWKAELKI